MLRILTLIGLLFLLTQALPAVTLEQYLTDKLVADYQLDPDLIQINVIRSSLTHDTLDDFDIEAYPVTHTAPRGRFPMKVELSRDGAIVDRGAVSLDVRIFADLPVPVQNIKRHEILSADMFTLERFDITSITEQLLIDEKQMAGCRARQNLPAGRYVAMRRVEAVPDVENGSNVTIVGKGAAFEIRARGIALQTGIVGETIKIKNVDSRKILVGKVAGPGMVEISI
jgi:flagella basal body P-ring formation protein FlgA